MNLSQLLPLLDGYEPLVNIVDALGRRKRRAPLVEGVPVAAKGFFLARIQHDLSRPLLLVTYSEEQASRLAEDLRRFLPENALPVRLLPSSLSLVLDDEESGRDVSRAGQRVATLTGLANGEQSHLIAPITALLQKVPPPAVLKNRRITVSVGDSVNLDVLSARLTAFGYIREDQVSLPGTFARRGDILDVFPADSPKPIRIDLFGDEVETIRPFDRETQRSEGKQPSIIIPAAHEVAYTRETMASASATLRKRLEKQIAVLRKDGTDTEHLDRLRESVEDDATKLSQAVYFSGVERYLPLLHPDSVCALDYIPENALIILDEPAQMESHAERDITVVRKNLANRANRGEIILLPEPLCLDFADTGKRLTENRQSLSFSLLARSVSWLSHDAHFHTDAAPAESFAGKPALLGEALRTYKNKMNARVVVVSVQAPRVRAVLTERELGEAPLSGLQKTSGIALVDGVLRSGFRLTDGRLVVLTDTEVFGTPGDRIEAQKRRKREFRDGMRITSLLELNAGDYVVHIQHGIGQFTGLTRMTVQGAEREYMAIVYEGGDKLFVPSDQVDRVQRYIGSEGAAPHISKLGGNDWERAKTRAKKQVKEIAQDLIILYAARSAMEGHSYGADTPWQIEMEEAFPHTETPDQLAAIDEVKKDLEAPRPMDRLICGDVGYGKTEVAVRAAFKVASEGRQVAVLCPTTVLAAQHLNVFSERLSAFPMKVDMMSRFRSTKELAKTAEEIKLGAVDIVVGTHRLLSKDIEWKDLGLVIVDEEQRFGVTHKERLKQMRQTVDVLAMSATPIPRTLQMSLSGIRDMSLINDPPEGRMPVKTYIKEYDEELIRDALQAELDRGGQAFFLHNRVESIYHIAHKLEKIIPACRFRVAHGQMGEDELEETMLDFYEHKFDCLVCTTIVESGLDVPNVNTILIDNADKLGLSQLYQLRGRVGRSRRQGFCFLMYRKSKSLTTVAEQRLGALREFSDLGSGYKIALRDLELRGAGNILGAEQSGTVASVGFDLYTQLLEEAVKEMKGGVPQEKEEPLPTVDLPVAASIPEKYVPGEAQRILMYKKLAAVKQRDDVARLQEEFEDRFGDPPQPVWNLLSLLRLRLRCKEIGIESITTEGITIAILFNKETKLPTATIRPLTMAFKSQGGTFNEGRVSIAIQSAKVLRQVEEMVEVLAKAIQEKNSPPSTNASTSKPSERVRRAVTAPRR